MELSKRQKQIITIVKENEPISGDKIAAHLNLTKPTLRSDLAVLTMTGILDARPKVGYIYSGQPVEPLLFEKLYNQPVAEITVPPIFIKQSTSIQNAVTDLFMYDVGSLYVISDEKEFLGVISRKDLLRGSVGDNIDQVPVALIMTRMPNIVTVNQDMRILDAGYLLMNHQVDSLPVVETGDPKKVVGKISKTRLMQHFVTVGLDIEKNNQE